MTLLDAIPHGPGIRFLDSIEDLSSFELRAKVVPEIGRELRSRDGTISSTHAIEYIGQAIAVHQAFRRADLIFHPSRLGAGFIAKLKNVTFDRAAFLPGGPLTVHIEMRDDADGAASYHGVVRDGEDTVVVRGDFLIAFGAQIGTGGDS